MSNKTRSTLTSEINANINDNGANEITAEDVRTRLIDIVDSYPNLTDDAEKLGLKAYNTGNTYQIGESCIESGTIYVANTITTGTFNPAHWDAVGSSTKAISFNGNKFQNPSAVAVDGGTTTLVLAETPPAGCRIDVFVNGELLHCGDGDKTKNFYLSSDGGTTAKSFSALAQGDTLYFNAVITGWNLETDDEVSIFYEKIQ